MEGKKEGALEGEKKGGEELSKGKGGEASQKSNRLGHRLDGGKKNEGLKETDTRHYQASVMPCNFGKGVPFI